MSLKVRYVAAVADHSGYGFAGRNYIGALLDTGEVDLSVRAVSFEKQKTSHGPIFDRIAPLIDKPLKADVQITHLTPENYPINKDPRAYNIAYVVWETDRLPPKWADLCNTMDEIWTSSDWSVEVFKKNGIQKPVFKIPHGFSTPDLTDTPELSLDISEDTFKFYSIFQWIERKHPLGLLKAYLTEFDPDEKVCLILKSYRLNTSQDEQDKIKRDIATVKVALNLKRYPRIFFFGNLMAAEYINALHKLGDCFVMSHRSEAFGQCCKLGTPIFTKEGPVPIEQVSEGDEVLTHRGRLRKVSKLFQRNVSEELIQIVAYGSNQTIELTEEHPVYAFKRPKKELQKGRRWEDQVPRWIPARELEKGDCVIFPSVEQHSFRSFFDLKDYDVGTSEPFRKGKHSSKSWHLKSGDTALLIRSIKKVPYTGLVYNLEVEDDHSYTTGGFVVHNCFAEALSMGNPVIGTRYSGNLEFMTDENSYLINCQLTPCCGMIFPNYNGKMTWAEPDIDHLKKLMRQVFTDREEAAKRALKGRLTIAKDFSWKKIGQMMVDRLKAIQDQAMRSK